MFRAQSNIFDDVVVKATDENLTSENWEYILVRAVLGGRCRAYHRDPNIALLLTSCCRMYATRSGPRTRALKMPSLP